MADTSSQQFVPIQEIRNGVVVLKDGGLRAVLMTTAVNMALKSIEEQEATIAQFQNTLNTFEFDIQILVQSRRLDIEPYLETLEKHKEKQKEELLRIQTTEYIEFIKYFTEQVNVMTKNFYIVIPYSAPAATTSKTSTFGGLFAGKKKKDSAAELAFEEKRAQLEQRVGIVSEGITRLGMRVKQLDTEQLVELYYQFFNPGDTARSMNIDDQQ